MPDKLQALLAQAKLAGPLDRIEFRDPIASHGVAAVPAMSAWIADPALGGFAVRVLERIGREADARSAVIDALMGARARCPEPVRDDIERALIGMGKRVTRRRAKAEAG